MDIGIIDLATPTPFVTGHSFHRYGEVAAEVASGPGAAFATNVDALAYLRGRFEQLWGMRITGTGRASTCTASPAPCAADSRQ